MKTKNDVWIDNCPCCGGEPVVRYGSSFRWVIVVGKVKTWSATIHCENRCLKSKTSPATSNIVAAERYVANVWNKRVR